MRMIHQPCCFQRLMHPQLLTSDPWQALWVNCVNQELGKGLGASSNNVQKTPTKVCNAFLNKFCLNILQFIQNLLYRYVFQICMVCKGLKCRTWGTPPKISVLISESISNSTKTYNADQNVEDSQNGIAHRRCNGRNQQEGAGLSLSHKQKSSNCSSTGVFAASQWSELQSYLQG